MDEDKNRKEENQEIHIILEFITVMLALLVYLFTKG